MKPRETGFDDLLNEALAAPVKPRESTMGKAALLQRVVNG